MLRTSGTGFGALNQQAGGLGPASSRVDNIRCAFIESAGDLSGPYSSPAARRERRPSVTGALCIPALGPGPDAAGGASVRGSETATPLGIV
jgi:hypothetical protein